MIIFFWQIGDCCAGQSFYPCRFQINYILNQVNLAVDIITLYDGYLQFSLGLGLDIQIAMQFRLTSGYEYFNDICISPSSR